MVSDLAKWKKNGKKGKTSSTSSIGKNGINLILIGKSWTYKTDGIWYRLCLLKNGRLLNHSPGQIQVMKFNWRRSFIRWLLLFSMLAMGTGIFTVFLLQRDTTRQPKEFPSSADIASGKGISFFESDGDTL